MKRFGREGTECDGIFFTEGIIEGSTSLGEIKIDSGRQNIALDVLKKQIAVQVKAKGGNALQNFNYVQQGTVFSFSSTRWRVTGTAVIAKELGNV
jgi:hypothetical protein